MHSIIYQMLISKPLKYLIYSLCPIIPSVPMMTPFFQLVDISKTLPVGRAWADRRRSFSSHTQISARWIRSPLDMRTNTGCHFYIGGTPIGRSSKKIINLLNEFENNYRVNTKQSIAERILQRIFSIFSSSFDERRKNLTLVIEMMDVLM